MACDPLDHVTALYGVTTAKRFPADLIFRLIRIETEAF
jgi:hypothetical protein